MPGHCQPKADLAWLDSSEWYLKRSEGHMTSGVRIVIVFVFVFVFVRVERGYGVLSFDEPAEGEEGGASENGSAPSVRVPFTVLPNGIPPLIPQSGRVRNLFLWRVEMHLLLPWKLFWAIITGTGNPTRRRVMGFGVILSHVAVAGSIVFT